MVKGKASAQDLHNHWELLCRNLLAVVRLRPLLDAVNPLNLRDIQAALEMQPVSTDEHSGLLIEIVCHELALEPESVVSLKRQNRKILAAVGCVTIGTDKEEYFLEL